MKENRPYYKRDRHINRLIRVFNEHGNDLSTNQIMDHLSNQRSVTGLLYTNQPHKGKVAQYLSKYPYFERVGTSIEKSIANNKMRVAVWKLAEDIE
tara:strand:+ start:1564 stop:1851 length:288 start_codon:yes stop_codon:yes gene_type:complete